MSNDLIMFVLNSIYVYKYLNIYTIVSVVTYYHKLLHLNHQTEHILMKLYY